MFLTMRLSQILKLGKSISRGVHYSAQTWTKPDQTGTTKFDRDDIL